MEQEVRTIKVVGELIERHVNEKPDAEAIVCNGRRITWKEYDRQSDRAAMGLLKLGVKKGDRVGIYMPGWPEFLYIYLGAAKIGAITVPVSWQFTPQEIMFVINNAEVSVLVMAAGFMGIDMLNNFEAVRDRLPTLKHLVMLEQDKAKHGMIPFNKFLTDANPTLAAAEATVSPENAVIFIYTSGTTGIPKAAILTNKNLIAYVGWQIDISYLIGENTVLCNTPLNHVGGAVMGVISCLAAGNKLALMDHFNAEDTLQFIQDEKITVIGQVPAQYALELLNPNIEKYDLSSVALAIVSSQPCPSELITAIQKHMGVTPQNAYGLTEVSGAISCTLPEHGEDKLKHTVGVPSPGIDLVIMDPEGKILPTGQVGEIAIKGDAVMKGYWKRPDEDAKAFDKQDYFHTGDMGLLDQDGCLTIVGRKKEMFIRGGENVYPPEVEEAVAQHPDVFMVAVVGRPHAVMGEVGRAYIIRRPGASPTAEGIGEFLRERLVKYKIPEDIIFRDSLPMTPLGKIKKLELYEEIRKEYEKSL